MLFNQLLMAGELLIIVAKNSALTTLTHQQLDRIYRKKIQLTPSNERWIPVNLHSNDPLRIAFSKALFKQPPEEMEHFWNIQYYEGISPPYVVSSEEAVIRFIMNTPGAIGYINNCHSDSRVRVLMKLNIQKDLTSFCKPL